MPSCVPHIHSVWVHGAPPSPSPLPPPPSPSLQQCTVLREGQQGFTFESNRGSRVEMKAESSSVQFDFAPRNPWCSGKKTYKTKQELLEEKVSPAPSSLPSPFLPLFPPSLPPSPPSSSSPYFPLHSFPASCSVNDVACWMYTVCAVYPNLPPPPAVQAACS